nr:MAG TPA: hypothetical protein [Caudoviricetes sp.]
MKCYCISSTVIPAACIISASASKAAELSTVAPISISSWFKRTRSCSNASQVE